MAARQAIFKDAELAFVGGTAASPQATAASPTTLNVATGVGTIIIRVAIRNSASQNVNSITVGSQAATLIGASTQGTSVRIELWRVFLPTAGSFTVTVNMSAACAFSVDARTYFGASAIRSSSFASGTGSSTSPSVSTGVALTAGDVAIGGVAGVGDTGGTITVAASTAGLMIPRQQTYRTGTTGTGEVVAADADTWAPGGAGVASAWAISASTPWAAVTVALVPDAAWFDNGVVVSSWPTPSQFTSAINAGQSVSISFTALAGTDRALIVGLDSRSLSTGEQIAGVTYGGLAMTRIGVVTYGSGVFGQTTLYGLLSPPNQTANIVVTVGGVNLSILDVNPLYLTGIVGWGAPKTATKSSGTKLLSPSGSGVNNDAIVVFGSGEAGFTPTPVDKRLTIKTQTGSNLGAAFGYSLQGAPDSFAYNDASTVAGGILAAALTASTSAPPTVALVSSIAAAADLSTTLRQRIRMLASVDAQAALDAALTLGLIRTHITSSIQAQSAVSALLRTRVLLSAEAGGQAFVDGNLRVRVRLSPTVAAQASVDASVRQRIRFAASIVANGGIEGLLGDGTTPASPYIHSRPPMTGVVTSVAANGTVTIATTTGIVVEVTSSGEVQYLATGGQV